MPHLWEYDHPYYCAEGNYYKADNHERYESWADFTGELWFIGDRDLNLLFRWDWKSPRREPDPDYRSDSPDSLLLFFVQQRKARQYSCQITVTDEDEPAVRAFLADCAQKMREVWEPLLEPGRPAGWLLKAEGDPPADWPQQGHLSDA